MRRKIGRRWGAVLLLGAALGWGTMTTEGQAQDPSGEAILARFERMVQFNLDNEHVWSSGRIDSLMRRIEGEPLGERIAFWADAFYEDGRTRYRFGLDPGGYVTEGRLCDDFAMDCVLFFYRITELGRSSSAREAVQFAFGTRFYGASVEEAILPDGRVRYDHFSHLDYSEDILRTGIWGANVTEKIGPIARDPGNVRFGPDTLSYVPKERIDTSALRSGDLVYFLLDENHPKGSEDRAGGTLIAHLGILARQGDRVDLIHAAQRGLEGLYEGGRIEKVPLKTYLERVDRFKG
ncbi:MAG: hypothetical protein GF328_11130, partial [Candidatus Latescibacteria bacterium]|nr:hypothetical protein [Candidatus Latescibacterota bacterium]